MARVSRIGRVAALVAVVVALVVPASEASAGDGPVATKSGALINYVTGGKLKIGKRITIGVVCSADCNATATLKLKGPGVKVKGHGVGVARRELATLRAAAVRGCGPSWPTTMYLAGSATLRKTFIVMVCPGFVPASWLQEVIVPAPGTT